MTRGRIKKLVLNLCTDDNTCDFQEAREWVKAIWFEPLTGTTGDFVILTHMFFLVSKFIG